MSANLEAVKATVADINNIVQGLAANVTAAVTKIDNFVSSAGVAVADDAEMPALVTTLQGVATTLTNIGQSLNTAVGSIPTPAAPPAA